MSNDSTDPLAKLSNANRLRVIQVTQWIIEGRRSKEIISGAMALWDISESTAWRLNRAAKEVAEGSIRESVDGMQAMFHREHMELYRTARDNGDISSALSVLKDWQRLVGAYATGTTDTSASEEARNTTPDQRAEQIAEILDRVRRRAEEQGLEEVDQTLN